MKFGRADFGKNPVTFDNIVARFLDLLKKMSPHVPTMYPEGLKTLKNN